VIAVYDISIFIVIYELVADNKGEWGL